MTSYGYFLTNALAVVDATPLFKYGELGAPIVCIKVFDMACNMGPYHAAVNLQRALMAAGSSALTVDGVIGPRTTAAAQQFAEHPATLMAALRMAMWSRYLEIVKADPSQKVFLAGWTNRALH